MKEPQPIVVVAETPRLRVREKRIEDAPAEYAWRKDPEVARYDATPPLILSYREFVQQFERDLRFDNPVRHAYAIETVEGDDRAEPFRHPLETKVDLGLRDGPGRLPVGRAQYP